MLTVVLMPPRSEYVKYFVDVARQYDVVIAEVPNVEGVRRFLSGEIGFDELLYEIEYWDLEYTRSFYTSLRELERKGVTVIPVDPYAVSAMRIRTAMVVKGSVDGLMDHGDRYIAYIEAMIGDVTRRYNASLLRRDFDGAVNYTIKYARMDAERIKFRSELRAREIIKGLSNVRGDVLIHADYYHEVLTNYLGTKLGCRVGVIPLMSVVGKKLGVTIPKPPGLKLTLDHINRRTLSPEEERELGARTLLYVILRSRVMGRMGELRDYDKGIIADSAILRFVYRLRYDEIKNLFYRLMPRNIFRIKL